MNGTEDMEEAMTGDPHPEVNIRFYPVRTGEGGGRWMQPPPPPSLRFCPLLKKSSDDSYLKLLVFSQVLAADAYLIFFFPKIYFKPSHSTFDTPSIKSYIFPLFKKSFINPN